MEGGMGFYFLPIDQSRFAGASGASSRKSTWKTCRLLAGLPTDSDRRELTQWKSRPSGSITASLAFCSGVTGLILGGSISQNNFFGSGNGVSTAPTVPSIRTALLRLPQPVLHSDGDELGYNAFYRHDRTMRAERRYLQATPWDSYGAGFHIGYQVSDSLTAVFGLTLSRTKSRKASFHVQEIRDFLDLRASSFTNFQVQHDWSQSTYERGACPWNRGFSQSAQSGKKPCRVVTCILQARFTVPSASSRYSEDLDSAHASTGFSRSLGLGLESPF